jgi:hypothetical protein
MGFTGNTSEWAAPKDQDAFFSDFSVAITQSSNALIVHRHALLYHLVPIVVAILIR